MLGEWLKMNLKAFRKLNVKKQLFVGTGILFIILLAIVIVYQSYALYMEQKTYDVIKGQVPDYQIPDIKVAVLVDGVPSRTFPAKDSNVFYSGISCNQPVDVFWNVIDWNLDVSHITAPTKCTVSFQSGEKKSLHDTILNQDGGINAIKAKGVPDYQVETTNDEGLYWAQDDYGDSYYYRGAVKDNYVFFAGFYWRIIRVNGDGSIRLIYQGKKADSTGVDAVISQSPYSNREYDNALIGYMGGSTNSSNYQSAHQNLYTSLMKHTIDLWYKNNLEKYSSYFSDTLFCSDRSLYTGTYSHFASNTGLGYGNNTTYYKAVERLYILHAPTLKCTQQNDRFTVSDTTIGNGALTYPIAAVTADELSMAGAIYANNGAVGANYLNITLWWLTMTPYGYFSDKGWADVFDMRGYGDIYSWNVHDNIGIRPVINLKNDVSFVFGNGTMNDPFRIV